MSLQSTRLQQGTNDVLTVPSDKTYANVGIYFCNTDSSATETLDMFCVKAGAAAGVNNTIIKNLDIPKEQTFKFGFEKFLLDAGDTIVVSGSAGNLVSSTLTFIEV